MTNELVSSAHSVGESNLHLQFTPAYRRDIFADPMVRELTTAYVVEKAKELGVHVAAIECGPDHLHTFIVGWKRFSIAELARQLKGYSAYMMRRGHAWMFDDKLWGEKFWSGGYFYRTVGAVNAETVKRYVKEGQRKHWVEKSAAGQTTLFHYGG